MMTFWVLAAVMLLVPLIVVARVFLKGSVTGNANPNMVSLAIYERRLMELERDKNSGILTEEQAGAEKLELEKALVEEVNSHVGDTGYTQGRAVKQKDRLAAGIIILLLPLLSIPAYFQLGSPELINVASPSPQQIAGEHGDIRIEEMVSRLAQKMRQNPDDAEGWRMLVRSYMALGRFTDAVSAVEQLYRLTGDEPGVLLQYADALAMANNSSMAGKPEELVQKALSLDPDNITGLWLAGMASRERGDFDSAIDYWQRVLPLLNDAEDISSVSGLISSARAMLGGETAEQAESETVTTAGNGPEINVTVTLNPELTGEVSGDHALFVIAQETAGPPMPIAVVRKQVKDLPLEITLDDSDAMVPTRKLSGFEEVKIGARISRSGNAIPQKGDLTAEPVIVKTAMKETVSLLIDRKVQ